MGSFGYQSRAPVDGDVRAEILAEVGRLARDREWSSEPLVFFEHPELPGHVVGDTKLGGSSRDAAFIIETLVRWSATYGIEWDITIEGEPIGSLRGSGPDAPVRDFLAVLAKHTAAEPVRQRKSRGKAMDRELVGRWSRPQAAEAQRELQHRLVQKSLERANRESQRELARTQHHRDKLTDPETADEIVATVRKIARELWPGCGPNQEIPDLRGITLNGTVWNLNLGAVDFSFAHAEKGLANTDIGFQQCVLDGSIFRGIRTELHIQHCSARGCNFDGANLKYNSFAGSDVAYSSFDRANLAESRFDKNDLTGCSFRNANLRNVYFSFVRLDNTSFSGAKSMGATLDGDEQAFRDLVRSG